MKKNLIAVFLCLCILAGSAFSATAQSTSDPTGEDTFGTTVQPTAPVVEKVALKSCTITLSSTAYTYNATEKKPKITVKSGEKTFKSGVDFTVVYKDNVNAGTAKAVVTAAANSEVLTGTVTKYFRIDKRDIASLKTKSISQKDYVYSGAEKKPTLSFSSGSLKAVLGKDFTLSYKNNKNVGIATVTAKGKGNFTGTYSKTFSIRPQKVTGVKVSKVKDTTFKLSWKAVGGNIDGYRIYRYNKTSKEYEFAVATSNNYFNVAGRAPATTYKYIVKAYKKTDSRLVLGDASAVKKVIMKPEKVSVKPSAYKGKYFIFKWEKAKASGYEIKYSTDKKIAKNVKVKTVKSGKTTSLKVKLSSEKKYYYKIRAYKVIGGKTYYGAWSSKKCTQFSNVYSSYSTTFYSPAGRTTNIKVACSYINGTILRPGDIFSFNEVVGRRTPERGFKVATVYDGQETKEGYGGGVCQVSSTIFNAALLGNLPIVERYQHSMTVHYVPYGRDAAISWGSADFKFKNSTSGDMKISAKVYNNNKVEIKLLTNTSQKPKKVSLNVSSSYYNEEQRRYVLTRSVDGKVNYSTSSIY